MNPIPVVSSDDFEKKVQRSEKPVLVWFTVPGCAPCRKMEPILVSLYYSQKRKIDFFRLDITKDAEMAQGFKVTNTPTIIFFQDGEEVSRLDSMPTKTEILEVIDTLK